MILPFSLTFLLSVVFASSEIESSSSHDVLLSAFKPLSLPFRAEIPAHFPENDVDFLETDFLDSLNQIPMREASPVAIVDRSTSCYADTVIQMLFRIPVIRKIVANLDVYRSRAKLLEFEHLENLFKVIEGLNHMFYQLQTNETQCANYDFGLSMQVLPGPYIEALPGDAEEYFSFLICVFMEITPESQHHRFILNFSLLKNGSFFKTDISTRISLHIMHDSPKMLDQLLAHHFAPESVLTMHEESITIAKKLQNLPEIITIHLQRTSFDFGSITKKNDLIRIPEEIDFADYISDLAEGQSAKYRLKMFITHIGIASNGHFISYHRNSSSSWCIFDDSRVELEVDPEILQERLDTGYIYFYERI